jgi:hypothetical protein
MTSGPIAEFLRDIRASKAARRPGFGPYDKGDLAVWIDIHGKPRDALVERVTPDHIEIRVASALGNTVVHVAPEELSPR